MLGLALAGPIHADLVAWWRLDDGSGTIASDSSGNGYDGDVEGGAQWVDGQIGGALSFNGSNSLVRAPYIPLDSRTFTITMWVYPDLYTSEQIVFSQRQTSATDTDMHFRIYGPGSGRVRMGFYNNDLDTTMTLDENNWYHDRGDWAYWGWMFFDIESVEKINDYKVAIHMSTPNSSIMTSLAMFTVCIVSEKAAQEYGDDYFKNPVGTGPFEFIEWVKDDHITLRAFEDYWRARAKIDEVIEVLKNFRKY